MPDALDRLYGRQLAEGGWSWGANSPADLQLSAYVAMGLWEAQQAGFTVRTEALAATLAQGEAPVPYLNFLFWALLTPLVYMILRRWPYSVRPLLKTLLVHIAFSLLIAS